MDGPYEITTFFISYEGTLTSEDRLLKRNCSSTLKVDKDIKRVVDLCSVLAQIYIVVKANRHQVRLKTLPI